MKTNNIVLIVVAILVALITFQATSYFTNKKVEKAKLELRKERIKNDSLVQISESLYSKLVADTLALRELRKINDSLELELETPVVVTRVVAAPKDKETTIDDIAVTDSTFTFTDYYPEKEDAFVTYSAEVDTKSKTGKGEFKFKEIELSLGIGQNEDGTYSLNTKVPEFLTINNIQVQGTPLEPLQEKPDNFGLILGAGVGQDFRDDSMFGKIEAGIRFKKVYLDLEAATNQTISTSLKFEF